MYPEQLGASVKEVASLTGESEWTVKNKLRRGIYRGRKSGRRTIVEFKSVREAWDKLPEAKYSPVKKKG
jgi:hypothetical protein